jgi:hypothetical protein
MWDIKKRYFRDQYINNLDHLSIQLLLRFCLFAVLISIILLINCPRIPEANYPKAYGTNLKERALSEMLIEEHVDLFNHCFKCQNAPEKSAAYESAFAADSFFKKQFAFLEN